MKRKLPFAASLFLLLLASVLLIQIPLGARAADSPWQAYIYNGPTGSRPYFVYTPTHYQAGTAVPLLVMLHGCTQTAPDFANSTDMNQLAEQHNFIVVYPQQTALYNTALCWNWYDPANQVRGGGEAAIIAGIVQSIEQDTAHWTIDTRHIYVEGLSAGGALAVTLGAVYPDIFAAIGVHAGCEYQAATTPAGFVQVASTGGPSPVKQGKLAYAAMGSRARVVPTIVFQGSNDPIINVVNGDQVVQQWMQTDQLASHHTYTPSFSSPSSTTHGQVAGGLAYTVARWQDHNGREIQEYWKIAGMGHAWSGGSGPFGNPFGPDASQASYTFFMQHPQ
ncbi:MAG: PHB depolymerase family esterase [Chloroflexota bacterium]|nr:PHB depolymerase family esterase [Chloroflexota bacterium]